MSETAVIRTSVYDGTRKLVPKSMDLLVTIRDGNQKRIHRKHHKGPTIEFQVPFFNNLGDNYTVIVFTKGYLQAGFAPVKVSDTKPQIVDLMVLPKKNQLNFFKARWGTLKKNHPQLFQLMAHGAPNVSKAKSRYEEFMEDQPGSLAALLNITTAMQEIHLPTGTALGYFKELIWDRESMKQDRFFAFADATLVDQVRQAADHGHFDPQFGLDLTHPGATASFKQVQFGEANVQFSFHEEDRNSIDGTDCVKVEVDMDYFKDSLAHFLLEVIPNKISGGDTDPRKIYMLRWMAGRRAGVAEFDPPYAIVPVST